MPDDDFLFAGTDHAVDIIKPKDSISSTPDPLDKFLDGSVVSSDIFTEMESGIWWWCIIHNNLTTMNLDIVYATPTVYFEYRDFIDGLIEFTQEYFDTNVPTVPLFKLPGLEKINYLTNPNITNEDFSGNLTTLVYGTFNPTLDTENVVISTPTNVYSVCSFRRILDPVHEYLEKKQTIDAALLSDIENDLLFSFVLFEKNKRNDSTLAQRIADLELQIDQLLVLKQRAISLIDTGLFTPEVLNRLLTKIAELEAARQKLLDLKERYDAFNK